MTKANLLAQMAGKTRIQKEQVTKIVESLFATIHEALIKKKKLIFSASRASSSSKEPQKRHETPD